MIRLDPPQVSGQAFPYSTGLPERRDWPGLEHARELSYLLLPPPDPRVNMYVNSMRRIAQPDGSARFEVETVSGLIVRVDGHLVPTSCYFADGMPAYTLLAGRISSVVALLLHDGRAMRLRVPVESTPVAVAPQR